MPLRTKPDLLLDTSTKNFMQWCSVCGVRGADGITNLLLVQIEYRGANVPDPDALNLCPRCQASFEVILKSFRGGLTIQITASRP